MTTTNNEILAARVPSRSRNRTYSSVTCTTEEGKTGSLGRRFKEETFFKKIYGEVECINPTAQDLVCTSSQSSSLCGDSISYSTTNGTAFSDVFFAIGILLIIPMVIFSFIIAAYFNKS